MSIELWPLTRRLDFIRQLHDAGRPIGKHQLEFQGDVTFHDVHVVEIGFPCYRLGNGRTQAAQSEIVAREGLDDDFFTADPDSEAALARQDEILRGMVTSGTDAQILDILRRGQQTQPLILDQQGYVVNGNRRLCAMRLLFEEDPAKYSRFQHVQVCFLPPCSQNDIDELEARLQWLPDGRSDYSWVDKSIVLRQRQHRGWSVEKISSFYEMSRNEVQLWIAMLEDAEAYLEERGWLGEYSRVLNKQYAFEQLQRGRKKCGDDEPKKQLFTAVAYVMLDDADATGRRLYESIPDALNVLDDIAEQVMTDLGSDVTDAAVGTDDGLDILGDGNESVYTGVVELIRGAETGDGVRDVIRDKIEEKRREAREQRDATYCLREARKAYTSLQNVRSNLGDDADTVGLPALLDNIQAACDEIRGELADG